VSYSNLQRRILATNDAPQHTPDHSPTKTGSSFELLAREDLHHSAADHKIQRLSPPGNDLRLSNLTQKKPEFQAAKSAGSAVRYPVRLLIKSV
jgi:hypothetical protein